ncbi:MAG: deoxyribodipyrimidine photo-lyase [Candidatus Obscuribacterales bacterium]|nr:deoxyribodipyrimidine photo-lyase [Steroidobacteraceae bacterium]
MHQAAIVWLRRDLRLADNPALTYACEHARRIVVAFIYAPEEEAPWQPGAASGWWLHHSLASLAQHLGKLKQSLVIRRGPTLAALQQLIGESGATLVIWNRLYEPAIIARDAQIKTTLREASIDAQSFNAALLFEPWEIKTQLAKPFRVFTPFWRACSTQLERIIPPEAAPNKISAIATALQSEPLNSLQLLPRVNWDAGFSRTWQPGEVGAHKALQGFLANTLADYKTSRDRPAVAGTSQLSPQLHFGELGPRQVHAALKAENTARSAQGSDAYLRQLGWREFAHHLLYHFPHTTDGPFNPRFAEFNWDRNSAALLTWQRGQTGIPWVDAGMRELWTTGYMHNRVRMIVASLLTKNLRVHWIEGARWFWDTLVDADLANNSLGWQWVAGSGADAAPYFRVFNPVLQGERFDPQCIYLRRWLPELAKLPDKWMHQPWSASVSVLKAAGVHLGETYPHPIVDLARSREQALQSYKESQT